MPLTAFFFLTSGTLKREVAELTSELERRLTETAEDAAERAQRAESWRRRLVEKTVGPGGEAKASLEIERLRVAARDHERRLREVQQKLAEQGTRNRAAREDLLQRAELERSTNRSGRRGDPFDRQTGSSRGGARGLDLPSCRQCAPEGAAASDLQAVQSLVICLWSANKSSR